MKHLIFLLFLFLGCSVVAQNPYSLSESAEISIITIGPGKNLYDKFGHTAVRVSDPQNQIDWVYNYGTYDFETPNFYTKFAQGKLLYELSVWKFPPFLKAYERQNRWVKEQVLDLTLNEQNQLFRYLQNNAKPENSKYKYDFFYDNCATKIRDVLQEVLQEKLTYHESFVDTTYTFRELIQKNVHWNTWGSLGMDVAIGAVVDRPATAWEYQFLPEYVYQAAEAATLTTDTGTKPLIKQQKTLFENTPQQEGHAFFVSPLFIFLILALFLIWITFKDARNNTRSRYLDGIILTLTGVIGCVLFLLWFATDHTSTVTNYNVLWAFPFSILFGYAISKKTPKKWVGRYLVFLLVLLALLTLHSITGVQSFAWGLSPLLVALAIRYFYVMRYIKRL